MNFNLWFQIVELRDIWDEAILELKSKNKLNESKLLSSNKELWNDEFNKALGTFGMDWVSHANQTAEIWFKNNWPSGYSKYYEAKDTIFTEALSSALSCMTVGWILSRGIEKGEDDAKLVKCRKTKDKLKEILGKPENEKIAWFKKIIERRVKATSDAYKDKNRLIRRAPKDTKFDPIYQHIDPRKPQTMHATSDFRLPLSDEEGSKLRDITLSDEEVTKLRDTIINIIKDKQAKSPHPTAPIWDRTLKAYETLYKNKWGPENNTVKAALGYTIDDNTASKILRMLSNASDEAKEQLGISQERSPRHSRIKRPGAGKRAIGG